MTDFIGWIFAAVFGGFWAIEHIGGREIRDELRELLRRGGVR